MVMLIQERFIFLIVAWIVMGMVVNRSFGVESLQLYVIVTLIAAFIQFGTSRNKKNTGKASPYEFLNPNDLRDLEEEVVPHVGVKRLASVLGVAAAADDIDLTNIPDETTEAGAALRKLCARSHLSMEEQRALIQRYRGAVKLPLGGEACCCKATMPGSGDEKRFDQCCLPLQQWLAKNKKCE